MTIVKVIVAIDNPGISYNLTAIAVDKDAAAILTRLFPIKINPRSLWFYQVIKPYSTHAPYSLDVLDDMI